MRLIVGIVLVALVAAALVFGLRRKDAAGTGAPASGGVKEATAAAERGGLKIVVLAQGKISAKNSEKVAHKVEGALTIATLVPEGKDVVKDEELVVFDSAKQKQEVDSAEADGKNCATEVEIAERALEIAQRENAESLSQAQFKYNSSQLELEKCEKGDLPQQERKLLLDIERAESEVKQAKESYDSITSPDAVKLGFVTPVEIEKERLRLRSAEMQVELSAGDLKLFKTYTSRVTLSTKRSDVDAARANSAMVESVNANKAQQKRAELQSKQERLRVSQNHLKECKERLAGTVLKAPIAGVVLYGEPDEHPWYYGGERIRVGGQVSMNQVIITLPRMDELVVKVPIAETDINKLKKGMQAVVTSDAYPNMKEVGTISMIGNVAKRTWMDATNNYEVEIGLRKGDLGIKPGVSTKAEILVEELKDVLKVPISAVFNNEGRNIVYVKAGGVTAARDVKVGSASDTHIAIVSGLQEGETVLLYEPENVPLPPAPLEAETKSGTGGTRETPAPAAAGVAP